MSQPPSRILNVADIDLSFERANWAFAQDQAREIEAHWAARKAKLPLLFDGRVLLARWHEFARRDDGQTILRGACFEVDYKAFLAWRDFDFPGPPVGNIFSMAALRAADGAFLLGEMAPHTANGGSVYFPAGTPDLSDVAGDRVDLDASARRELFEETGIAPDEVEIAPDWRVIVSPPRIGCMKLMRIDADAQNVKARVDAFLAADPGAELSSLRIVRGPADVAGLNCPPFVAEFLNDAFARDQSAWG